ncbi:MAG: hypothetical protein WCI95_00885 [bacterium]
MSEDIKSGSGPIPPRLTIVKPGQSDDSAATAPEAVTFVPPSNPVANPATGLPPNKKKTARIPLDQVSTEPGVTVSSAGMVSKTIRLSPAMTGMGSVVPMPSVGKVLSGMNVSDDTKRKTSRISLEAVLPQLEAAAAGGDTGPKTIRIKRPTMAAPGSSPPLPALETGAVAPTEPSPKSQTTRVDIPPEATAEGQQTQKKTIKIRRAEGVGPEVKAGPRLVSISRNETETAAASVQVVAPHWSFVLMATAAVVTMCVMLYVLMAQAYPSLGWTL